MKKVLLFIVLSTLAFVACQKENVSTESNQETAAPVPGGENLSTNFCEGCGFSKTPMFTCLLSHFDLGDGHMIFYCGTGGANGGKGCPIVHINDSANNNNYTSLLDLNQGYKVRDSFLINSLKGQNYISYYYYIGAVMAEHNTLNFSNLFQHLDFAHDVYTVANRLMYGSDSEIVFTNSFKAKALDLINYYRPIETSPVFQEALNKIESDLNFFVNLNRGQILSNLSLNQH